jgi:PAS domain S-box-containing protein
MPPHAVPPPETPTPQPEAGLRFHEPVDRLLAVWAGSPDAMAISDAAGIVLDVNPAYGALYGYAPDELIGQDFAVVFAEEARPAAHALYQEVFHGAAAAVGYEATVRRRDGAERIVEARVSFLSAVPGQHDAAEQASSASTTSGDPAPRQVLPGPSSRVAMLSIIRDVTDLVEARRELTAALAREQEALALRNQVLSQVSHDLKNSVTGILGGTQLLQRQLLRADRRDPKDLVADLTEGLDRIVDQARAMAADLNELLDTAQLAAGQPVPLARQPTDLVALARQVVTETAVPSAAHQLVTEAHVRELVGNWDRYRLERVLRNLLANALKYSPQGGTITVSVAKVATGPDLQAQLSVQDQGMGIPAADLPNVFERYYRAQNAMGETPGMGLGLAGVRDIVELHGGTVRVVSEVGQGCTFVIALPLSGE